MVTSSSSIPPPSHGKVKFGPLMGALKLVRTSTKLDDFDALFLHNVCFFQQTALSVVFILRTNAFLDTLEVERTSLEGPPILDSM